MFVCFFFKFKAIRILYVRFYNRKENRTGKIEEYFKQINLKKVFNTFVKYFEIYVV